nr:MAG TPA: hypothetical protein [Caudoviricetes sp.]
MGFYIFLMWLLKLIDTGPAIILYLIYLFCYKYSNEGGTGYR